jgi:hypothetical protein
MTPADVPAAITADSRFPWLHAIAPPVEPVRTLSPRAEAADREAARAAAPEPEPLRRAA